MSIKTLTTTSITTTATATKKGTKRYCWDNENLSQNFKTTVEIVRLIISYPEAEYHIGVRGRRGVIIQVKRGRK